MTVSLTFIGSGSAHSSDLGNSCALISLPTRKNLLIDLGGEAFFGVNDAGVDFDAIFITHCHLDHIAGLERLFFQRAFSQKPLIKLFVPATIVLRLHQVLGMSGSQVAEGGRNFWDCFQLIPVGEHFYFENHRFRVFPSRHHFPNEAFGISLAGHFVYTGDTRPIPEQLVSHAGSGELIFHDASITSNPSHSSLEDIEREYRFHDFLDRIVLYHLGSEAEVTKAESLGWACARPGSTFSLPLSRTESYRKAGQASSGATHALEMAK